MLPTSENLALYTATPDTSRPLYNPPLLRLRDALAIMSADTSPQSPAFQQLTADNRGPVVIVASYIFLVISVIVVFTRLITRFQISRRFASDDYCIIASTVFLIGQTLAITFAVNNGLGRHRDAVSDVTFDKFAKVGCAVFSRPSFLIPI